MIHVYGTEQPAFLLNTANTSYAFHITAEGLAEHLHYGSRIELPKVNNPIGEPTGEASEQSRLISDTFRAMTEKVSHAKGTTVNYSKDSLTVTEDMLLEVSSLGKGDFREPAVILEYADGTRTSDFIFRSYRTEPYPALRGLPGALPPLSDEMSEDSSSDSNTLTITLVERHRSAELDIIFTVYEDADVITRRCVLRNTGDQPIKIHKLMSLQLDLDESGYTLTSFGGNWGREMHRKDTPVAHGNVVISSRAGVSSNRANPFVMLTAPDITETAGEGYGFNLIYSGDHYESAGVSGFGKTRFVSGINPESFSWLLGPESPAAAELIGSSHVPAANSCFETPEAVMTYSDSGYRGVSRAMHLFVRRYIVRGKFAGKARPILLNSWEAAYFNISESALLNLAAKGRDAGVELFVMDDGWFLGRNNDQSSLGDWTVDKKKLPRGVEHLAKKVHGLGLDFGIWVEPEMISEDSNLFRAHPEYAMTIPGRENSPGRNQMILDLTNPEVVEYVKDSMRAVFGIPGVNYVKWDMNRMFADVFSKVLPAERQGETMHRYYLGLYDIMRSLTEEFPDVLFEGCSSGGNRFDLGILAYMPQIWGSDDTDAYERTIIQTGYSYGYPMSTVTAHVSACPNHQTLRNTPLDTRFNIASFGVLGYELHLGEINNEDFSAVQSQTALYKKWRDVFFFGDFYRVTPTEWMVVSPDRRRAVAVTWNVHAEPNSFYLKLKCAGLDPKLTYHVSNIPMKHNLKQFGDLVNQVAPIHIKKDSLVHNTIAHFVKMDGETEDYTMSGAALIASGIKLCQAFGGTGYNNETRLYQDFASRMYFFEATD